MVYYIIQTCDARKHKYATYKGFLWYANKTSCSQVELEIVVLGGVKEI